MISGEIPKVDLERGEITILWRRESWSRARWAFWRGARVPVIERGELTFFWGSGQWTLLQEDEASREAYGELLHPYFLDAQLQIGLTRAWDRAKHLRALTSSSAAC